MKTDVLNYSLYQMYNPKTGEIIVGEECDDDAKSLKGYWLGGFLDEPHFNDETLRTAWEDYFEKLGNDNSDSINTWDVLDGFLEEFDNPEWKAYEITSYGIACGPVSSTVIYIVDENVIVEELG